MGVTEFENKRPIGLKIKKTDWIYIRFGNWKRTVNPIGVHLEKKKKPKLLAIKPDPPQNKKH